MVSIPVLPRASARMFPMPCILYHRVITGKPGVSGTFKQISVKTFLILYKIVHRYILKATAGDDHHSDPEPLFLIAIRIEESTVL